MICRWPFRWLGKPVRYKSAVLTHTAMSQCSPVVSDTVQILNMWVFPHLWYYMKSPCQSYQATWDDTQRIMAWKKYATRFSSFIWTYFCLFVKHFLTFYMVLSFLFQRQCMQPLSTVTAEADDVEDIFDDIVLSRTQPTVCSLKTQSTWCFHHSDTNHFISCKHTEHICATWDGFVFFFCMARNTLSRICALHQGKL